MNVNILWWWKNYQPQAKLIIFGTDAAYPHPFALDNNGYSEHLYCKKESTYAHSGYVESKRSLYRGLQEIAKGSETNGFYHFIITSLFGPDFLGSDGHFVHYLIHEIATASRNNEDVSIDFNRLQKRERIYAPDLVHNILWCVGLMHPDKVAMSNIAMNLGSHIKKDSIENYVLTICNVINYDYLRVTFIKEDNKNEELIENLDSSMAMEFLGDLYSDSMLENSLKETIEYYYDRYI